MIPISVVRLGEDAERLAVEVIRSGALAQGPMVERFEAGIAQLVGARHAVAVNNGTTALVAALSVLDLEPGDEVVTSPFTFAATLNAILESGATARFADIAEDDFCVDPAVVSGVASAQTKVLLPVHLYGQVADVAAIGAAAPAAQVVEDAAQALGATTLGGRLACFSFYGTKNVTTGEGGAIATDDPGLADRLRLLRNQGMRNRYEYVVPGHNWRLTDLAAALAIPHLAGYPETVARRRANAARLTEGLAGIDGLRTPAARRPHVWHQYTVLVDDRDALAAGLAERGVGSGVYYPRVVFDHDCYRKHPRVVADDVPVARSVASRCLSLPVHQHLSDSEVDQVIDAVREVMSL